jgi:hypothetical protein
MHAIDGIPYANNRIALPCVVAVRALDDYRLWLRFDTGDERIFDFKPMLKYPVFKPLTDKTLFDSVYLNMGTTMWGDGENTDIDIAPESLYEGSTPAPENALTPADRARHIVDCEKGYGDYHKESEFIDRMSDKEFDIFLKEVVAKNTARVLATA